MACSVCYMVYDIEIWCIVHSIWEFTKLRGRNLVYSVCYIGYTEIQQILHGSWEP